MLADYLPILMLLGLAALFAVGSVFIAARVGPHNPTPAKVAPYESGIVPEREPREKLPVKFYVVALLFIIFDVEVILLYPFAVVFRELGLYGLGVMGVFLFLLIIAFVYDWKAGGLDWEEEEQESARRVASARILEEARAADVGRKAV